MRVKLAGLELVNPVDRCQRNFGYCIEFEEIVSPPEPRLGAIVTNGRPRWSRWRATRRRGAWCRRRRAMLNAIGLQNVGVEEFIGTQTAANEALPRCKVIVMFSVHGERVRGGDRAAERRGGDRRVRAERVLPERARGGMAFGRMRVAWSTWWVARRPQRAGR